MSKQRRDRLYLGDIEEAIQRIVAYTTGLSLEQFLSNAMVQDAVLHNMQVIGEATKKLSPAIRRDHASLPWREMAGMRDKIVHEYFGVNLQIVWSVAQQDLPRLLPAIQAALAQLADETE